MLDKFPLNTALLSHWQNWLRVLLMVVIAGIAFDQFARLVSSRKKD